MSRRLRHLQYALILLGVSCSSDSTSPTDNPNPIGGITLSVDGASLATGETVQLSATLRSPSGDVVDVVAFEWASNKPGVASVTQTGLVTAVAAGTAEIRASAQGKTGTARIDVYVPPPSGAAGTIVVDPSQRFQTMRGWQVGTDWGFEHALAATVREPLLDRAVNELGIDRVRLPVRSGTENSRDWFGEYRAGTTPYEIYRCNRYATVNDNADPHSINPAGFRWTDLDEHVEQTVVPLRQRLRALGEDLYVVLTYIAHTKQNCPGTQFQHTDGEEYAEFLVATFQHLQGKYGLVPDEVELVNEPDWGWTYGSQPLSAMLEAAGRRLRAAGFNAPFMGPSTMSASVAIQYYNDMIAAPGNAALVSELSYHRYLGGTGDLNDIGQLAKSRGISAVMGEKMGASTQQLYEDLTIANAASWEQGTLAFYRYAGWQDIGNSQYNIDFSNPSAPVIALGRLSRPLRQYYRYVRQGAVRIGATSQDGAYRPVAFINKNGGYVTVIWTDQGGTFTISGLNAGTYGVNYTTDAQMNVESSALSVSAGQLATVSIPAAGVVTVYRK